MELIPYRISQGMYEQIYWFIYRARQEFKPGNYKKSYDLLIWIIPLK